VIGAIKQRPGIRKRKRGLKFKGNVPQEKAGLEKRLNKGTGGGGPGLMTSGFLGHETRLACFVDEGDCKNAGGRTRKKDKGIKSTRAPNTRCFGSKDSL